MRATAVAVVAAVIDGGADTLTTALESVKQSTREDPVFQGVLGIVSGIIRVASVYNVPVSDVLATWATATEAREG